MAFGAALPLAIASLAACTGERPVPATSAGDWIVGATPIFTIGATEAGPGQELAQVSGARWAGGRIVIANSGSGELRVFDSAGTFRGAEGRKGQGPGEFLGVIYLAPAAADSLYTFDAGNLRWSLHDGAGRFVRVLRGGASALPRPAWLYDRTLVESNTQPRLPEWVFGVLVDLPEGTGAAPVRRARVDDLGFLWVTDSLAQNVWLVYAGRGPAVGRVVLPGGFAMFQAGAGFVLGVERDAMDREVVRAYSLRRAAGLKPPAAEPAEEVDLPDPRLAVRMASDLTAVLITAQEVFYSRHGRYTGAADSLTASLTSGAEAALLVGDAHHWAGILFDPDSKATCGVAVGYPAPAGWIDGTPVCGR